MENKIDGAVIVLVDIDVSKRSMERIKEAGDYAAAVIETVRESLVVLDSNLRVKTANRAFYNTFQTSREETENKFIYELGNGQWNIPELRTLLEDVLPKSAQFVSFEVSHEFPHIGPKTMILNARRIYAKENTQMVLLAIEDITERKYAEGVKRKEVLLKEIHHRVKNNLQVISSLLSLQAGHLKDAAVIEMFKETQSRIRSMSLIHEQLYKNMELVNIHFGNYVQNLVSYLFHTYGARDRILLKTTADDILLNVDTVMPCSLIVNELVSNSLKHAFPGDKKGEIYVGISSEGDGNYMLTVGDNGVGFPEDLDFRDTQSLRLQLLLMLVEQIEGRIELNRSNGTEFKIVFRELGKKTEL